MDENYKQEVITQIKRAREVGYAEGVRATEARFRPDGKLTFCEVALCVERQMHRFEPRHHDFIRKMGRYARQEFEPSPKEGRYLFGIFCETLGGRII
jgi:hypothetical protein